ncbi:hypothetical protein ACLQ3D_28590 [Micromonospora vinacea]
MSLPQGDVKLLDTRRRRGLRPTWVGVVDFQERFPARTPQLVRAALSGDQ